jgi:hypothetical protein
MYQFLVDEVVLTCNSSALLISPGNGENSIASDAASMSPHEDTVDAIYHEFDLEIRDTELVGCPHSMLNGFSKHVSLGKTAMHERLPADWST